jgi:hypothetical protein
MTRALLVALVVLPAVATAQRAPNVQGPRTAAQRAANRTDARTAQQEAAGREAAPAATAAVPQGGTGAATAAPADSARPAGQTSVAQRGARGELSVEREVFSYAADGRRDPFQSLVNTTELRPFLSDLTLAGIIYDASGRNSLAILRENNGPTYRVRVGQALGRMKVAQINQRDVIFTIDEFGFSRQETLALPSDTNAVRTP